MVGQGDQQDQANRTWDKAEVASAGRCQTPDRETAVPPPDSAPPLSAPPLSAPPRDAEAILAGIRAGTVTTLSGDQGPLIIRSVAADRRASHRRACLRAVRKVARVALRESHPRDLLDRACAALVETEGYRDAWIALLDDRGWLEHLAVSPGLRDVHASLLGILKGDTKPYCTRRALASQTPIVVRDPLRDCGVCPLTEAYPGLARLSRAITFSDRIFGVIAVAIPEDVAPDDEEQAILDDLASDLGFVLHKLEHAASVARATTNYRSLFENARLPMWLVDPQTGILQDANNAAMGHYGWSRAELVGRSIHAINPMKPEDLRAEMRNAAACKRNHFNFLHRCADASIRNVEVFSGPIERDGKPILFSIMVDVTERVRQDQELRDTQVVFEEAQRVAQIGWYDFSISQGVWTSSPVLDDIFGIGADYNRLVEGWLDLVHSEDRPMMRDHLMGWVLRQRNAFDKVYRIRRRDDGAVRWVHGRGQLTFDRNGDPARLLGTIQDVTDQQAATQRLNDIILDLNMALRIAGMGTWLYCPSRQVFHVSEAFRQITGIPVADSTVTQVAVLGVMDSGDRDAFHADLMATVRDGVPLDRRVHVRRDSEQRVLHVIAQPDTNWGPSGGCVRGVVQDVTDQDCAWVELQAAKDAADAANRIKTEFLANVSHEIRTPLNAVIGFAEVLGGEMLGPLGVPKYVEYARDIVQSGKDLLSLVDDVIDLSRIEVGAMELNDSWLEVEATIATVVRLFTPRAEAKGIALRSDVTGGPSRLCADDLRLRQILGNLVSNALKFTPAGGTVMVRAARDTDGNAVLSVIDTGVGIAPDQLSRVMSVFGRGSDAYVRAQEGSGLGLPLCARLAALHQARLEIDSDPGTGTAVHVIFPTRRTG